MRDLQRRSPRPLLQTADYRMEKSTRGTARVLEERIEQAHEANAQLWESMRQLVQERK